MESSLHSYLTEMHNVDHLQIELQGLAVHRTSNSGQMACGAAVFVDGIGDLKVHNCTFVVCDRTLAPP